MPFNSQPPRQPESQGNEDRYPLTRLSGLYPSKAGNALTGNAMDRIIGDLERVIADAKASGRPLRFLVFENQRGGQNSPPYMLQVTLGNARTTGPSGWGQSGGYQQPAPAPYAPPDPDGGELPGGEEDDTPPDWVQQPAAPPPAPSRTRRMPPPRG